MGTPEPDDRQSTDLDSRDFVAGPGHGAPGVSGPAYLEGTYSRDLDPDKSEDAAGMQKFFKQFSFPGGISAVTSRRKHPGSIHEGGELGYSLSHAYGAAFDNPDLIVAVRHRRRRSRDRAARDARGTPTNFSTPNRDGAVLPILNLERVQDRQSDHPCTRISHEERELRCSVRLRLHAVFRRRSRSRR